MKIVIKFLTGPEKGKSQEFSSDEVGIGRSSDNDIVFDRNKYGMISRRHASIRIVDGEYTLIDNESANGTFLNGAETKEARLKVGDCIMFGPDGPEIQVTYLSTLASLTFLTGPLEGDKKLLSEESVTVGRDDTNGIVLPDYMVSRVHARIEFRDGDYWLIDEQSKNGTYIDGRKIDRTALKHGNVIRFGVDGPELKFEYQGKRRKAAVYEPEEENSQRRRRGPVYEAEPVEERNHRRRMEPVYEPEIERASKRRKEHLYPEEVQRGAGSRRRSRTEVIVYNAVKKWKVMVIVLAVLLIGVVGGIGFQFYRVSSLDKEIKKRGQEFEAEVIGWENQNPDERRKMIAQKYDEIKEKQQELKKLKKMLFIKPTTVEDAINKIMDKFGADEDSVPPGIKDEVIKEIRRYKRDLERIEKRKRDYWKKIVEIFKENNLEEELGYIAWVESEFKLDAVNPKSGATGMWQFMPLTARDFGLKMDTEVDDRKDFEKSTRAAASYIKHLIKDVFRGKRHFLLVVASYNYGQGHVKKKMTETVREDRREQMRDDLGADAGFSKPGELYYSILQKCPDETKQYIPRFLAAIIIGTVPEILDSKEIEEASD